MILCDAGPLVALVRPYEPPHAACAAVWHGLIEPVFTTWPCLGEAMYLAGPSRYVVLWDLVKARDIQFFDPTPVADRVRALMVKYADAPMDLGDATLVAAAETLGIRRVFTLDGHFYSYRIHDRTPFDVIR